VPVTIAALVGTTDEDAGLGSGLINTTQQIGGALGLAILAAVATAVTSDLVSQGPPDLNALNEGFQAAFLAGAGLAVLGLIATLVLIKSSDSKAHTEIGLEVKAEAAAEASEIW
jgi:hypothetical protein